MRGGVLGCLQEKLEKFLWGLVAECGTFVCFFAESYCFILFYHLSYMLIYF